MNYPPQRSQLEYQFYVKQPNMPTDQGEIKYIAVLGATGNQGGGVVRALLAQTEPSFHVRAITRDVSSPAAQRLQAKYKDSGRLEFVAADVYNKQSLIEAFQNVYGVFAVTNNRIAGKKIEKEQDMDHELVAGRNIIDAAKVCLFSVYPYQSPSTMNDGKEEG